MIFQFLSSLKGLGYFLLRLISGLLFTCHGAQKMFGVMGADRASDPLMIVGGIVELVGGILIATGLVTQLAAFLCAGQMAVAYWMFHASKGFWPIENGGEMALLYFIIFFYVMAHQGGRYSLDNLLGRNSGSG
jgi:putative oxidoreductase